MMPLIISFFSDNVNDFFNIVLILYIGIPLLTAGMYAILYLIFLILIRKSITRFSYEMPAEEDLPEISVLIAARNEEEHIAAAVRSVAQQDYPANKFEILVIDDSSEDKTAEIVRNLTADYPHLRLIDGSAKTFEGKKGALQLGVSETANNFIAVTDADCSHDRQWLRGIASAFLSGADITFGIAPLQGKKNLVSAAARYENFRGQLLSALFSYFGKPHSAAARSFGYTKEAFIIVGGYTNTLATQSGDDDLFMREGLKRNLKIKPFYQKDTFAYSDTKSEWAAYFEQRRRHTQTSNHYLFYHLALLTMWHLLNIIALFSFALCLLSCYFILLFIVKFVFDILIAAQFERSFGYRFTFLEKMYLPLGYEVLLIVHFFRSLFGKPEWK